MKRRYITGAPPKKTNPRFTVYMTEEIKGRLMEAAESRGISLNEAICEAVEFWIEAQEG